MTETEGKIRDSVKNVNTMDKLADPITTELMRQANQISNNKSNGEGKEMVMMPKGNKKNGHVMIVGSGAAGGNNAHILNKFGFATMAANSCEDDARHLVVDHKFIIKDAFGSGKEPKLAKMKFIDDSDRFLEFFLEASKNQNTVIVICGGGGGTGAGTGPMTAKFIKDNTDKNVFLFCILGDITEDINSQQNMAKVLEEILMADVPYMIFDNGIAKNNSNSIDEVYRKVNMEIVEAARVIAKEHFVDNTRSNIDMADTKRLWSYNKRMIIVSGDFDKKISGKCDYEQQMIDRVKTAYQPGIDESPVSAYGFFTNIDEDLYKDIDKDFRKVQGEFGEPYHIFRHMQNKSEGPDFSIIIAGLDEPVTRYQQIQKRIDEFNQRKTARRTFADVDKATIDVEGIGIAQIPSETIKKPQGINKAALDMFKD